MDQRVHHSSLDSEIFSLSKMFLYNSDTSNKLPVYNACATAFQKRRVRRFSSRISLPFFPLVPRGNGATTERREASAGCVARTARNFYLAAEMETPSGISRTPYRVQGNPCIVGQRAYRERGKKKRTKVKREREDPSFRRTIPERSRKLENNWSGVAYRGRLAGNRTFLTSRPELSSTERRNRRKNFSRPARAGESFDSRPKRMITHS